VYRRFRLLLLRVGLIKLERERCWREVSKITVRLAPTLAPNDRRPQRRPSGS
jgi:hypothetical protein